MTVKRTPVALLLVVLQACVLAISLGIPVSASAQTSDAPDGEESASDTDAKVGERPVFVDEVVVTAQKREENLQHVPLSVKAFAATQIEEAGIETPDHFIALTPNVSIANSFTVGNSFVTIRGISQINNSDPSVAVVVDGVNLPNQKQLTRELFDIERVEVLKGPQGALYGRNSLGGVINIVTKQPTNEFEGYISADAGNGSSLGLTAAVGGPMVKDRLLFRVAGSYKESDGLIENSFLQGKVDSYEDTTGRLQLKWMPNDRLQVDLNAATSETEGGAAYYSIFPTEGFTNDFSIEPDANILGFSERQMDDLSLRAVWQTSWATLTSITAFSDLEETYRSDLDFSNPTRDLFFPLGQLGQGQDLDVGLFSEELRLTSLDEEGTRWICGAYYLETDRDLTTRVFVDTNGTIDGFFPFLVVEESNDNKAYAFFSQVDLEIAERWAVSGAMRYDKDERNQTDVASGLRRSTSFDEWQPKLTLEYQASDKAMAYLNLSTGFRSGGFNAPTVTPEIFKNETTENLEIGFKTTLWGDRLRLNGAAYLTRGHDVQYFSVDLPGQVIDNIAETEMKGLELDLFARVARNWDLYAAFGFNDSEIRDFDGTGRFVGNQTPSNIRHSINLGAQYVYPIGSRMFGIARIDLERRGKQYWHPDNLDVQDPVELVNLRFSIEGASWAVTAWARNLTDERFYVEYMDAFWGGALLVNDLGQLNMPRTYGIKLKRRF